MESSETKVIYEFRVLDELTEIFEYLSVNVSDIFADKFLEEFYEKTEKLKKYPSFYSFSSLPSLQKKGYRRILLQSYYIFYKYQNNIVSVSAIIHSKRHPNAFESLE